MTAKDNPLVSVVIPCYNGEEYVAEAIHSICDQTYENIEIVFVDDGSSDNSLREALEANDRSCGERNIIAIILGKNVGPCIAVDIGFSDAHGSYACMLAADDAFAHINHISDVIDTMEATGAAWCYNTIMLKGEHIRTAEPVQTKWMATSRLDNIILRFPKICEKLLKHRNPVNSSSLMFDMDEYRRNNLSWSGGKARSVCDGIILRQMFRKRLRGVALHSLGAFYREHDKQFSKTGQYMREHEDFRKEVT